METKNLIIAFWVLLWAFVILLITALFLSDEKNHEIDNQKLSDDLIAYYGDVCDLYNASDDCYLQTNGTRINCSELTKICAGDEE